MAQSIAIAILTAGLTLAPVWHPAGATTLSPQAQSDPIPVPMAETDDCREQLDSEDNCARIIGCIGTDGDWFEGVVRGWETGLMTLTAKSGLTCTGTFVYREILDAGSVKAACSGEDEIELKFFRRESEKGVITGTGITRNGMRISTWTGNGLGDYLTARNKDGLPHIACGPVTLDIQQ